MLDLQNPDSTHINILPILHFWKYAKFENKVQKIENRAQKIIGKPLPYSMKNYLIVRRIAAYVH